MVLTVKSPFFFLFLWLFNFFLGIQIGLNPTWPSTYWLKQSNCDHSLFHRKTFRGITVLLVYVDIMIHGDDKSNNIASLKKKLQSSFTWKILGHLIYFLGLEITPTVTDIFLPQHKHTKDLIDMAQMKDTKPFDTPMELNDDKLPHDQLLARKLWCCHVGSFSSIFGL